MSVEKRDSCAHTTSIVTDKTETFVDWDIQMSPVICATGPIDISVTSGYSVANTVGGSAGVDLKLVADRLGTSFGINYSRTWTSSTLINVKSTVNDGECGTMISRPIVTRRSGRMLSGCVGSLSEVGTWYADSHRETSYGGVSWVEGAISLCRKRQGGPPLSRCEGSDNFI
jgi:hypothetical protein